MAHDEFCSFSSLLFSLLPSEGWPIHQTDLRTGWREISLCECASVCVFVQASADQSIAKTRTIWPTSLGLSCVQGVCVRVRARRLDYCGAVLQTPAQVKLLWFLQATERGSGMGGRIKTNQQWEQPAGIWRERSIWWIPEQCRGEAATGYEWLGSVLTMYYTVRVQTYTDRKLAHTF